MYAGTYLICIVNRETAVKFNDYFEFPRELDMSPYTAAKLAKLEGTLYTHMYVHVNLSARACFRLSFLFRANNFAYMHVYYTDR